MIDDDEFGNPSCKQRLLEQEMNTIEGNLCHGKEDKKREYYKRTAEAVAERVCVRQKKRE